MNKVHYSSAKDDWATPQHLFDELNKEFNFHLDVCATNDNAKTKNYLSINEDALVCHWASIVSRSSSKACWMNPPYGKQIGKFIKKAYEESLKGCTVVCLLPARTDTRWYHDYILNKAEIRFIRRRLKFVGAKHAAPFPSMIAIYRPGK